MLLGICGHLTAADRVAKAVFIEPPNGAPDEVYLVAPEQSVIKASLPSRTFSPDIVLPKGDLVLAVLPKPLGEDEGIPAGAPTIEIPKTWSRVYLLFIHDRENKVFPLKVVPIDGSKNQFPAGDTRIVNLSAAMVRGQFGDKVVGVRPGKVGDLDAPINEFGPYPVSIDFMMKGDTKPSPLARTTWQHDPDSRQVVLITDPDGGKRLRIRALSDRVRVADAGE